MVVTNWTLHFALNNLQKGISQKITQNQRIPAKPIPWVDSVSPLKSMNFNGNMKSNFDGISSLPKFEMTSSSKNQNSRKQKLLRKKSSRKVIRPSSQRSSKTKESISNVVRLEFNRNRTGFKSKIMTAEK